jgi:hypothetical protein
VGALIKADTTVSDEVLNAIAHIPTPSLPSVVEEGFLEKLSDRDFMRIAVCLAQKVIAQAGLGEAVRARRTGLEAPRFLDWSGLLAVERADYEGAGAASGFA